MDERNERAVWGMLLEVCRKHQAQYFYMAPKFPNNLPFNKQVGRRYSWTLFELILFYFLLR